MYWVARNGGWRKWVQVNAPDFKKKKKIQRVFWPVPPAPAEKGWRPRTGLSVLYSPRSSKEQWAAKSPSGLLWAVRAQDRANIPEVAPPRGGGQGPGLAWHPCRASAALAAWPAREGARPPRAEQGRRESAARPRPGIWPPSPRPGRRRPAQRLSGSAGKRRRRARPWTPRARRHEVIVGAGRGSAPCAGRRGRTGPTRRRAGTFRLLGWFLSRCGRAQGTQTEG